MTSGARNHSGLTPKGDVVPWGGKNPAEAVQLRFRSGFDHFRVTGLEKTNPRELHDILGAQNLAPKIKRIRKISGDYLRVSLEKGTSTLEKVRDLLAPLGVSTKVQRLGKKSEKASRQIPEPRNQIKVLSLNVNGIKGKAEEVTAMLEALRPDIVCLQETKLTTKDRRTFIHGYNTHNFPADPENLGRGLLIGLRRNLGLYPKIVLSNPNLTVLELKGLKTKLFIGNMYRSPSKKKELLRLAAKEIKSRQESNLVMVGDWNDRPPTVARALQLKGARVFLNGSPTRGTRLTRLRRRSKRPIDFAVATQSNLIAEQSVMKRWGMSDHLPILTRINISAPRRPKKVRMFFDRKELFRSETREKLKNIPLREDACPRTLHQDLLKVLSEAGVYKRHNEKNSYISRPLRKLIEAKNEADRKVRKGLAPIETYKVAKANLKKAVGHEKRRKYNNYIKRGIEYLKNNDSKNAWRFINKAKRATTTASLIYKKGTTEISIDPHENMRIWTAHFEALGDEVRAEKDPEVVPSGKYAEVTDMPITWEEVTMALKKTRNGKACGPDGIPSEVYKITMDEEKPTSNLSMTILKIMNSTLVGEDFPEDWCDSVVVPIYKKGDRCDPENYRGIALIGTALKILTKVITNRLETVCNDLGVLVREQAGFLRREECVAQVATLLECCQRRKLKGKNTVLAFLDLRKAYDLVPHDKLFNKIASVGLGPVLVGFLKRMYAKTRLRVRINDELGEAVSYKRGVRQGCPISPLLFNLYVNDILKDCRGVEVIGLGSPLKGLLFADDTVLAAESDEIMASNLVKIALWCSENRMELNPGKCGVMRINGEGTPAQENERAVLLYNGEAIPNITRYVYLGVEFNEDLDMKAMSDFRVGEGRTALEQLRPTLSNPKIAIEYKRMLIANVILPKTLYGQEIYGMAESRMQRCKVILDKSIRCILKRNNFCRARAYQELDISSAYIKACATRARGFAKWRHSRCLIKDLIQDREKFKCRKRTWISQSVVWLKTMKIDLDLPAEELVPKVIENRSKKKEDSDKSRATDFARSLGIRSGKMLRRAQVHEMLPSKGVLALLKLRTGTFLFTKHLVQALDLDSRLRNICLFCGAEVEEDAWHYLLVCSLFSGARRASNMAELPQDADPAVKISVLRKLLSGEKEAAVRQPLELGMRHTVEFLSRAQTPRLAVIRLHVNPGQAPP